MKTYAHLISVFKKNPSEPQSQVSPKATENKSNTRTTPGNCLEYI